MRVLVFFLLLAGFAYAEPPELSPELQPALQLMNNGQLLEAYSTLKNMPNGQPRGKEALFLLAMTKWKMMWLSNYNAADRKEVLDLLSKVENLCSPILESDVDAQFYYASTIGVRAQVAATEGEWWETAQLGKKMKNQAQLILETDKDYYPAHYLLGSYNYFADALPGYLKFLRVLVFLPGGDRKEGSEQLVRAYEKGGITEAEAGRTLAMIYTYFERRFDYGKQMCDNLLSRYPDSYDVSLYRAINLYYSEEWDAAAESFEELRRRLAAYSAKNGSAESIVPVYYPMDREAQYWIARCRIQQKKWAEAREILNALADPPVHQPYWLQRGVLLSLAQINYNEKLDDQAEVQVEIVLKWQDVKESREKAKLLRKKKGEIKPFDIDFL